MKTKSRNTATLKLKFDFIDPRVDKLQTMLRAELDDLQERVEQLQIKLKGRERVKKPAPAVPPPHSDT